MEKEIVEVDGKKYEKVKVEKGICVDCVAKSNCILCLELPDCFC